MSNDDHGIDIEAKRAILRHALGGSPSTRSPGLLDDVDESQSLEGQLEFLHGHGVANPYYQMRSGIADGTTVVDGRVLLNYSSYNYVGLNGHPEVSAAAKEAIDRYGTSVSSSRALAGERPVHRALEEELAAFLGTEDCVVFVGGHATNVSTIGHLFGARDLVIHDELAHNSIVQGCILSGAKRLSFPHNDVGALDSLLERHRPDAARVLIAIEGVYSMDGDIPDLPRFIEVKKRHRATLLVDEAHSLGVLGPTGAGVGEHFGVARDDVELWMGTLSKSLASCGGYIAGSTRLARYLRYRNPGFLFSVGITPPNAAAALEALRVLRREPERAARVRARARLFVECARAAGLDAGLSEGTAVVPIILGDALRAARLSAALRESGICALPIVYPGVALGQERVRFFVCADHTERQVRETVAAVVRVLGSSETTSPKVE